MILILLGILCVFYCFSILFYIGHNTNFYFIWLFIGGIFILLGICLKKGIIKKYIPKGLQTASLVVILLLAVVFAFVQIRIISGFSTKEPERVDFIVCLGAHVRKSGPSRVLRMRLDETCKYLEKYPDTIVIVSGAKGKNEPFSEAQGMYEYLIEKGIDEAQIIKEDNSFNTNQNIQFSSAFFDMENDKIGIVTNNFHVFRATQIAKNYGYKHVYGIPATSEVLMLPNNMLREFFGVFKDVAVGNMGLF